MKPRSQSIFVSLGLPALIVGAALGLSGCDGPADDQSAMLLDLDGKAATHALVSPQETPVFMMSEEKRPAAMLLDLGGHEAMAKEATPVSLEEQEPASVK